MIRLSNIYSRPLAWPCPCTCTCQTFFCLVVKGLVLGLGREGVYAKTSDKLICIFDFIAVRSSAVITIQHAFSREGSQGTDDGLLLASFIIAPDHLRGSAQPNVVCRAQLQLLGLSGSPSDVAGHPAGMNNVAESLQRAIEEPDLAGEDADASRQPPAAGPDTDGAGDGRDGAPAATSQVPQDWLWQQAPLAPSPTPPEEQHTDDSPDTKLPDPGVHVQEEAVQAAVTAAAAAVAEAEPHAADSDGDDDDTGQDGSDADDVEALARLRMAKLQCYIHGLGGGRQFDDLSCLFWPIGDGRACMGV